MSKAPGNEMRIKMLIVAGLITVIGGGALMMQLFKLQFTDAEIYKQRAIAQQLRTTPISAKRGTIYDTNGKVLAKSGDVWTVFISPADISENELPLIADNLSQILNVDRQMIVDRGSNRKSYYQIIKQKIEKDVADQVLEFISEHKIKGVNLEEDTKRYYPYGNFAAQVLGFTGSENKGAYGIESYYDKVLGGTPGRVVSEKNALGTDMPYRYQEMFEAEDGNSIVLTIDEGIQHFLEKNLETALSEHKAKNKVSGIVMDVNTGAILAMATKSDFDPNKPFELLDPAAQARVEAAASNPELRKAAADKAKAAGEEKTEDEIVKQVRSEALKQEQYKQWMNKAITEPYEPGSVAKIITAAAALETGTSSLGDHFFCPGFHIVSGVRIGCHKAGGHGDQNFTEAMQNSCNPAFMMIGAKLGAKNYYDYFTKFGLNTVTGIDMPGEADNKKLVQPFELLNKPGGVELASVSFGQSYKVTPIQLITAVSAAVNGGTLYQPYIVKQVLDPEGNIISTTKPNAKRQVISEETSKSMRHLLEMVVQNGSGRNAKILGYRIGGKTGTSQKLEVERATGESANVLSFLGVAPADDPKIAVLVLIDEPFLKNIYGSVIAAPVVGAVLSDVLPYMGIEPKYTEEELAKMDQTVANYIGNQPHDAQSKLTALGLKARVIGNGGTVVKQIPAAGQSIPRTGVVILYTDDATDATKVLVPEVVGLTGQQANKTIVNAGLNIRLSGVDITLPGALAVRQSPEAGTEVEPGTVITVTIIDKDQAG